MPEQLPKLYDEGFPHTRGGDPFRWGGVTRPISFPHTYEGDPAVNIHRKLVRINT
jgi:hypothetical protein